MTDDTTIIPFHQLGSIIDPLTEIARDGARRMLMAALKAEADGFVARFSEDLLADGHQRIVRHGAGPERVIQTGIGPIEVRRQKVRDRSADVPAEAKVRFTSNILPKWARRSKSLDALLPVLCLRMTSLHLTQQQKMAKLPFRAALLHKSGDRRISPFPGQTYPTVSVTGMPSAVKPFRMATRTWNSAT